MDLGLHIANFTWSGGTSTFVDDLRRTARTAEDVGFAKLSVMDHVWQIGMHRPARARDARGLHDARLPRGRSPSGSSCSPGSRPSSYRDPGLLAKIVTTLDVLSGGRAVLGIGAAWNEEESAGSAWPSPPTAERFERLEETLQICLQMWSDDDGPYEGEHYRLGRTLNSPAAAAVGRTRRS